VSRPRLLLVPGFTELDWVIKPQLEEWAEVASYDPPGVGDEPLPDGDPEAFTPQLFVQRGEAELERMGWDRCFIVADGWGIPTGVRIAARRPDGVDGVALGHARLSHKTEGDRAPVNAELVAALTQLIKQDYGAFMRYGIAQATQGSISEERAQEMLDRFPKELMELGWERITGDHEPIEPLLREVAGPLLLAKHEGCIVSTEEGFEDAVAAFPEARTVATPQSPTTDPAFADALRAFCFEVMDAESASAGAEGPPRAGRAPGAADAT
jgi:pimeloyl-ACP methyl ester carboxylesterase